MMRKLNRKMKVLNIFRNRVLLGFTIFGVDSVCDGVSVIHNNV